MKTRRQPPVGYIKPNFKGLQEAGCIQAEHDSLEQMFGALYLETKGNLCNGCPVWESRGPACKAYQHYHSEARNAALTRQERIISAIGPCDKNGEKYEGMSVAEIAQSLGVSKSEVRRRKLAGTL